MIASSLGQMLLQIDLDGKALKETWTTLRHDSVSHFFANLLPHLIGM